MDILEAAQHWPNYARTRCMVDGERWPCPTWRAALASTPPSHDDRSHDVHAYVHSEHCASCAVNRPRKV